MIEIPTPPRSRAHLRHEVAAFSLAAFVAVLSTTSTTEVLGRDEPSAPNFVVILVDDKCVVDDWN